MPGMITVTLVAETNQVLDEDIAKIINAVPAAHLVRGRDPKEGEYVQVEGSKFHVKSVEVE